MNCPNCEKTIDEHEAGPCLDLWIIEDVLKWKRMKSPYKGDFYPEGSYFISWIPQDDHPCITGVSQAFDKDGNNLRATEDNPLGVWDESPSYSYSLAFSTDIKAACEIMEKIRDQSIDNQYKFVDILYGIMKHRGLPKGALMLLPLYIDPLAICRATLKAISE